MLAETPVSCPADCKSTCGNWVCEAWENSGTCPGDCPVCGDGKCSKSLGESCLTCAADCGKCPFSNGCKPSFLYATCDGCACEAQVCALDEWCCTKTFDKICVAECVALGMKCMP